MRRILNISTVILSVLLLNITFAKAQFVLKEADLQFSLYNYNKAVELYLNAYEKNKSFYTIQRLAESYRLMRNFEQAEKWYVLLVNSKEASAKDFLGYADILKNNAKYIEAKAQYVKYGDLVKNVDVTTLQLSCDSAIKWMNNQKAIQINNERKLNSPESDWGAVQVSQQLVFVSDRPNAIPSKINTAFLKLDGHKTPDKKMYGWTGNAYLKLYTKSNNDDVQLFGLEANTDYHVGAASFSADGNEVFYTLTRIPTKANQIKNNPITIPIEIYSSKKINGTWAKPVAFRYNDVKWSVGDPLLTDNGNTLYFVSDKPGGKGGTDIYVCKRNADGSWGDAVNLLGLNTVGNERTPCKGENGLFYFATDGYIGMGGLDIFKAKLNGVAVSEIQNMGFPINSALDDFAYYPTGQFSGYFSSNRLGGMGSDDIYSFTILK